MMDRSFARLAAPATLGAALLAFSLVAGSSAVASPPPSAPQGAGTILETMDAGSYTYARVDFGGRTDWVAAPTTKVAVGEAVAVPAGLLMEDFRSESLDRTFPRIWFVGSLAASDDPHAGHDHAKNPHGASDPHGANPHGMGGAGGMGGMGSMGGMGGDMGSGAAHMKSSATGVDLSGIAKFDGGQTVADLWTARDEHVGKAVAVRGRVVKYLPAIMGKNWLHVRDGSGEEGTNDITVTTSAEAAIGDLVVVRGTLIADRDFGMGYRYDLIVEDADVTVE